MLAEIVNILQKKNFAFNLAYFNSSTLFTVQYFACSYSGFYNGDQDTKVLSLYSEVSLTQGFLCDS